MKLQRRVFSLCIATILVFGTHNPAWADLVLTFAQESNANTVTATNPTASSTQIQGVDVGVTVTQIHPSAGLATPFHAVLNFTLNSSGAAATAIGIFDQKYTGSFTITSGLGGTGTNFLSGSGITADLVGPTQNALTLALFGTAPGGFSSGVIGPVGIPAGVGLAFGNVSGLPTSGGNTISLNANGTVNGFSSSVSGIFSASASSSASTAPEPTFAGMLCVGGIGWAIRAYRRRRTTAGQSAF